MTIIFLLGPPGVGKTTLGSRACRELGLEFLDFDAAPVTAPAGGGRGSDLEQLSRLAVDHTADVIELPWRLQREEQALVLVRRSGVPLLLWAHPEDMQARSGHAEPLFTPVPRLKIRGGFGRRGTGCREFRHLDRACGEALLLVDLPLEGAAQLVKDCIAEIREEYAMSPAEREGLADWEDEWGHDHNASPRVMKVITDAMARYLAHLRAGGTSSRTLAGVRSDLNAAGHLVLMYDAPGGKRILEHFHGPPWEEARRRQEAARAASEKARREREAAEARERHLTALAKREAEAWREVDTLIATKQPKRYDEAIALLCDLRDVCVRAGRQGEAATRLARLREEHAKKPGLIERFRKAALL